jgi:hypothetical protein
MLKRVFKQIHMPGSETIVFSNDKTTVYGVYHPFKTLRKQILSEAFDELLNNLNEVTRSTGELIIGGEGNVNWLSGSPNKNRLQTWAEDSECGLHYLSSGSFYRPRI